MAGSFSAFPGTHVPSSKPKKSDVVISPKKKAEITKTSAIQKLYFLRLDWSHPVATCTRQLDVGKRDHHQCWAAQML